jgi:hypothetical protein
MAVKTLESHKYHSATSSKETWMKTLSLS